MDFITAVKNGDFLETSIMMLLCLVSAVGWFIIMLEMIKESSKNKMVRELMSIDISKEGWSSKFVEKLNNPLVKRRLSLVIRHRKDLKKDISSESFRDSIRREIEMYM
tara:strand:+ start:89 stop:412 length:324 start_codon:yes stop_codon:yes gene_type:complete